MTGCWASQTMQTMQTMQNATVCFEEGHQNRCCNLTCVKPMWRSDCWSDPLSNQVPPFARQFLVAKWKWLRAPSQKANRSKAVEALAERGKGPGFMPTCQQPLHEEYVPLRIPSMSKRQSWIKLQVSTPLFISENPTSGMESRRCWAPFWKCQLFLSQATNHWFLASQRQQGREHINCSIQILLEAVQVFLSVSTIWPWSATRMLNLSLTATPRICATPDSKHIKETHLDQTVLVSARGTNRKTIQPLCQLEESCQDITKRSHNRRKILHINGMYSWTNTEGWAKRSFPTSSWLFEMTGRWAVVTLLWHQGHFGNKDTCLVLLWRGAELAKLCKLCKMLRSVSKKDIKTVVAIEVLKGPASSVSSQCEDLTAEVRMLLPAYWVYVIGLLKCAGRCHGMRCESMLYGCTGQASGPDRHVTLAILNWHQSFTTL